MGISMDFNIPPKMEFPTESLGSIMGPACEAISQNVQVPAEMAAQSLLANAALAVQQNYNVKLDEIISPTSLFFLTCAESGDRKSSSDKMASLPIRQHEKDMLEKHRSDDSLCPTGTTLAPLLTCSEPTFEGLFKQFEYGHPSLGLFSDEAGQFFGGHTMNRDNCMKSISGFSSYWDGGPINRVRVGESNVLHDRRLSAHLMLQPVILEPLINNDLLMQQGLFARFLMTEPESLAGTRLYAQNEGSNDSRLAPYYMNLKRLINNEIDLNELGGLKLNALEPDGSAKALWIEFYNETELKIQPGKELEPIKPTASRMPQQVLRISAIIAAMDDQERIRKSDMRNAIELGKFYLNSAIRIQFRAERSIQESRLALLLEWLKTLNKPFTTSFIQTRSPRNLKLRASADTVREMMSRLTAIEAVTVIQTDSNGNASKWEIKE